MGSTTLFTFLLELPIRAQVVELHGSWDNFTKPYQLQRDRRRGHGIWSGCWTFDDIICDGDLKNIGQRRSGALKMGGTYWYYYNVDGEECHNPSEPTTSVCPLLPGQHLNVLELPRESGSHDNVEGHDAFTLNPKDKFQTPVPPTLSKPLPTSRLGDLCKEPYAVPTVPLITPRSATCPSLTHVRSSGYVRHSRSASSTPPVSSTALLADFKYLKDKFAQKRSASQTRTGSKNIRHLQIGAPTLISTTAEDVTLVPLASLQRTPSPSPLPTPQTSRSLPTPGVPTTGTFLSASAGAQLQVLSPLRSHPVHCSEDPNLSPLSSVSVRKDYHTMCPRSLSEAASTTSPSLCAPANTLCASSRDARRTKLFCNEPWISSPRLVRQYEIDPEAATKDLAYIPVLEKPRPSLNVPSSDVRPTSSHGGGRVPGLRISTGDKNKKLPPLPRYLVPAPLYACNSPTSLPLVEKLPKKHEYQEVQVEDACFQILTEPKSHFSMWRSESGAFSSPASDDEDDYSTTFSSLTSDCSDDDSPHRYSRFSISDYIPSPDRSSAFVGENHQEEEQQDGSLAQPTLLTSLAKLDELPLSSFGPSLFDLDIQKANLAPRREAACFGLGFQGCKQPESDPDFTSTLTEKISPSQLAIHNSRDSSISRAETLVESHGFIGEFLK